MRRRVLASVAFIILAFALDLRRPPEHQLTSRGALVAIRVYQSSLAPIYARMGARCRFTPTCSRYSEACIRRFGAVRGGWLSVTRVVRCGPWTPMGTVDPPPI
jgi:putative membrane protein insertion efficiency factor